MDDGVKLVANIGYPSDLATGERASGPFPVLLTQAPYVASQQPSPFFVTRGYIHAVVQVRGTGDTSGPDGEPIVNEHLRTASGRGRGGPGGLGGEAPDVERQGRPAGVFATRHQPDLHRRRGGPGLAARGHPSRVRVERLRGVLLRRHAQPDPRPLRLVPERIALGREERRGQRRRRQGDQGRGPRRRTEGVRPGLLAGAVDRPRAAQGRREQDSGPVVERLATDRRSRARSTSTRSSRTRGLTGHRSVP